MKALCTKVRLRSLLTSRLKASRTFPNGATICKSLEELFQNCDCIFGCTGRDVFKGTEWWRDAKNDKLLVSCSSSDVEFSTILQSLKGFPPVDEGALNTLHVPLQRGSLTILRGGYPINFDGSRESVPSSQIQMTRSLLAGAVFQALLSTKLGNIKSKMLSPEIQKLVVMTWMDLYPEYRQLYPIGLKAVFENLAEIVKYSGGVAADDAMNA